MKKRLYLLLIIFISMFFMFENKVYAEEKCTQSSFPGCCYYVSGSSVTGERSVRLDFTNDEPTIISAFWYGKGEVTPKINLDKTTKEYLKTLNKCPEKIKFEKTTFGYKIYLGVTDDSVWSDKYSIIESEEPIDYTEEQNKQFDNILQGFVDDINSQIQEFKDMGCDNPNIYKPSSTEYNVVLAGECGKKNSFFTAANYSDQFKEAEKRGMTREKYSGLDNLYKTIESRNQFSEKLDEMNDALLGETESFVDPPKGDPMTCESLKNTDTYKIVKEIFKWLQIAAPIMLIIFGVIDFSKAVASGDNDAMKKAQSTFVKRVIVVAIIILLPFIMELLFSLLDGALGNDISTCEINK